MKSIYLLFFAILMNGVLQADVIRLKNGNIIEGRVVQNDPKGVVIDVNGAEMMLLARDVESIERREVTPGDNQGANSAPRSSTSSKAPYAAKRELSQNDLMALAEDTAERVRDTRTADDNQSRGAELQIYWQMERDLAAWANHLVEEGTQQEHDAAEAALDMMEERPQLKRAASYIRAVLAGGVARKIVSTGRLSEAVLMLTKAAEAAPFALTPKKERAALALREKEPNLVTEELEPLYELAPKAFAEDGEAIRILATAYVDSGKFRQAAELIDDVSPDELPPEALQQLLRQNAGPLSDGFLKAARRSLLRKEGDKTERLLKRSILLRGNLVTPQYAEEVSRLYFAMGDRSRALEWDSRAATIGGIEAGPGAGSSAGGKVAAKAKTSSTAKLASQPEENTGKAKKALSFKEATTTSLRKALRRARSEEKRILLYVGATWCPPCKRFKSTVLKEKATRDFIGRNFIWLQKDADVGDGRRVANQMRVSSYPTFLVLDESGRILYRQPGAPSTFEHFQELLSPYI